MNKRIVYTIMLAVLTIGASAQTENPRGIYKMITLTGKLGEVKAPYDQYKFCSDSVTLTISVQKEVFQVANTDRCVFEYTGDQPKSEYDRKSLIYDSDANHFTLKWWSTTSNHVHFPKNDWCIEKYEANQYSPEGRLAFDALNFVPTAADSKNPLLGTWRVLGDVDELRDVKKALPEMLENYETSKYNNVYYLYTPQSLAIIMKKDGGIVNQISYIDKNSYKLPKSVLRIKWLSKNRIAIEEKIDYRIDWKILERVTEKQSMMSRIASQYVPKRKN